MSGFRHKCIGRESLVGSFAAIPHPVAVEVMALSGLDFLCIDWEHAQISRDIIETMVRAADVHRVPAMVRVPGPAPEAIQAALDSGAQGVLVPRVSTPAQAAMAVKASRYPPRGERGVGPGRAAGYGDRIPEYLVGANDRIVVAVQVETAEGLANIEAIADVDGVDVIFVGPGDLSVSIDAIGPKGADKLTDAIRRIIGVAIAHDKTSGIFCASPQAIGQWAAIGVSFFVLASDTMYLGAGAAANYAAARAELAREDPR
ncbi:MULTISPECIES: HpcH/HpaI aldolase family protein [unclassified Mesorhizobium]|uniref:HpcH/HpaI aldolase family protein n=1 Tax=unclassified Mesorhizobium TaxID=325217 RepID=UPI00112A4F0F|nr:MULTISPECIES: HpcH/HpaI aldolase/citrate lyase family protein [unclassified Mesorhizobium]MBZ9697914.1 HpcH/HpaI aldolase/citrate lyase family protein [Mesorhizobium sp. CO1-1-9]TPK08314.1 HpcH/HpaI aldolase/citrate lyase family protein [Mesorhizobium sp. B2-5-7]